jgi:hypothetical protein
MDIKYRRSSQNLSKLNKLRVALIIIYLTYALIAILADVFQSKVICNVVFQDSQPNYEKCNYTSGILSLNQSVREVQSYSLLKEKPQDKNVFNTTTFNFFETTGLNTDPIYFAERHREEILNAYQAKQLLGNDILLSPNFSIPEKEKHE